MGRRDSSMSKFSLVKEMEDASLEFERGSEFFFFFFWEMASFL